MARKLVALIRDDYFDSPLAKPPLDLRHNVGLVTSVAARSCASRSLHLRYVELVHRRLNASELVMLTGGEMEGQRQPFAVDHQVQL